MTLWPFNAQEVRMKPAQWAAIVTMLVAVAVLRVEVVFAGDTLLVVRSEPGDWLGGGQTVILRPVDGSFTTSSQPRNGLVFRFNSPSQRWRIDAAAGRWRTLDLAAYGPGRSSLASGDTLARFELSGNSRGCESVGYFDVRQIQYDAAGVVRRIWMLFEHHCGDAPAAIFGELRIDADTTVTLQAPLRVRARRGEALSIPVTASSTSATLVTLSASSLPSSATFVDDGGGAGRLLWTPTLDQQGDFRVAFTARDEVGNSQSAHSLIQVAGDTLVDVVSEPGDRAGPGRSCRLRPGDMTMNAYSTLYVGQSHAYVTPKDPVVGLRIFSLLATRPGNYSVLRRWSDESFAGGSFVAESPPGSCGAMQSDFRVRRIDQGPPDTLSALWVEWEQHCDGEAPAFRGEIRINSGSPIVAYAPIARRVHYGQALGLHVMGRDTLGRSLALTAWPLPPGATFTNTGAAEAEFAWTPDGTQLGPWSVNFSATNSAGQADTVTTDIVVTDDVSATIVSERGDYAGGGGAAFYDGRPGMLLTTLLASASSLNTHVKINLYEPGRSWNMTVQSSNDPSVPTIRPGRYVMPWPKPVIGPMFFGSSGTNGTGYPVSADFRVRQIEQTRDGDPRRMWLEFEQRGQDRMPILRGEIRLDPRWKVMARAPLRRATTWGQPLEFEVSGETPDGENPLLSVVGMPARASFRPGAPGHGTFAWLPQAVDVLQERSVGFVARRSDGATDTAWTALEALPMATLHIDEETRSWELTSDLGQFRLNGGTSWAKATFSSPSADTLWSLDLDAGYPSVLSQRSYALGGYPNYLPTACIGIPGDPNSFEACYHDTGRFTIDWIARNSSEVPTALWATVLHGTYRPGYRRAATLRVGPADAVGVPSDEAVAEFECSGLLPNPTTHASGLRLALPRAGKVEVAVLDVSGRRLLAHIWPELGAGRHTLRLPGLESLAPGLYLIRLEYDGVHVVRRATIIR